MKKEVQIGDWVYSSREGIFRVEKIIERFYEERDLQLYPKKKIKVGDTYDHPIIVSKRLLNSKFKPSLGYDSCSRELISHLTKTDLKKLDKILSENPNLLEKLEKYEIPALQNIYNMDLQIDNEKDLKLVEDLMDFTEKGKSLQEIKNQMEKLSITHLIPQYFGNYTLQFLNLDYEYEDKCLVWKNPKLVKK